MPTQEPTTASWDHSAHHPLIINMTDDRRAARWQPAECLGSVLKKSMGREPCLCLGR